MTWLLLVAVLVLPVASSAAEVSLRSGPARTRLIELYSSEGCSSCPPADEWMATLLKSPGLWKDFVAVAFHVTCWDYLGWTDRFADPAYDARQRTYAASWGSESTYTPGWTLDGAEWRSWGGEAPRAAAAAGMLTASATGDIVVARFSPASDAGPYVAYAARLGFEESSRATSGENAGRLLRHEFVARGLARAAMKKKDGAWTVRLKLPPPSGAAPRREGLAVWVAGPDGLPAQAAGGFFP